MYASLDIRRIARPYLEQLAKVFGECVNMSIENNLHAVYVEVIRQTNVSLMAVQSVGNAVPLHCTSNGKLLLLNYSDDYLNPRLETFRQITLEISRKLGYQALEDVPTA